MKVANYNKFVNLATNMDAIAITIQHLKTSCGTMQFNTLNKHKT